MAGLADRRDQDDRHPVRTRPPPDLGHGVDVGRQLVANNYASSLKELGRFEEARSLLRKTIPVARRILGEGDDITLKMKWIYARALFEDPAATPDDLREAVTTLEDAERIARRVFGGAHPLTEGIEEDLRDAQALRAREAPSPSPSGSS